MQRLINAIDKATRAGVYNLEETAGILQAIDQVGSVVQQYNQKNKSEKDALEEASKNKEENSKKKNDNVLKEV